MTIPQQLPLLSSEQWTKWVRHSFCLIHTITIGTSINFNGGYNGHGLGLKNVACKQTLTPINFIYVLFRLHLKT